MRALQGPGEVAVWCPDTTRTHIEGLIGALRTAVAGALLLDSVTVHLSASVGSATHPVAVDCRAAGVGR